MIPLWGTRLEYYDKYLELVRCQRLDDVVVPNQRNPYQNHRAGALTAHRFEADMAERTLLEATIATRRFLQNYIIVILEEVPVTNIRYSMFAVTAPSRIFSFGPYYSIGYGLFARARSKVIRTATAEAMEAALKWPIRDFSSFELQIFALKRLADEGEPALALVGLMALVEWYLKENLPDRGQKRLNLSAIIRHPHYTFLPENIRSAIDSHRETRNFIVHEKPTDKTAHLDLRTGSFPAAPGSIAFYAAAAAAFELYRLVNISTSAAGKAGAASG
jgi:hypothetical protein